VRRARAFVIGACVATLVSVVARAEASGAAESAAVVADGYARVTITLRGAQKGEAAAFAPSLLRPQKPGVVAATLFVLLAPETNAVAASLLRLAERRGMTILSAAVAFASAPEALRNAALADLVTHMRKSAGVNHVLAFASAREADALRTLAKQHPDAIDGLLLHDAAPAPPPSAREPRTIETWGADAYWRTPPARASEAPQDAPRLRRFFLAGVVAQQAASANCAAPINARDGAPALRALFVALEAWVVMGAAPPASRIPALTPARTLTWPKIAGAIEPSRDERMTPALDADGNESSGLRLPDHTLPLATFTGWNARRDKSGAACAHGAAYAFARSKAERLATGDPRLSPPERYGSRAYFVATLRVIADKLVKERLLLPEDADASVAAAKQAPF
jgi:hypothetical protein